MYSISERLRILRQEMNNEGIDVFIIPTADFHQSEYVGAYFKAREYITGFSGSAGTVIVTKDEARLWTDGRYFVQAAKELAGTTVQLMKMGEPGVLSMEEYLKETLKADMVLGFDGRAVSLEEGVFYDKIAKNCGAIICYNKDIVSNIWPDRPELSKEPAFSLDVCYAGECRADKLARIRKVMEEKGATSHLLTSLDDICWLLNVRGNDIAYSPMVLGYAFITKEHVYYYVDQKKFSKELQAELIKDGIVFCDYDKIYEDISNIDVANILYDASKINYTLVKNIPDKVKRLEETNPEIAMKAIKNAKEIENMRMAHLKDSVAHIRFMKWVKEHYLTEEIRELTATDKLDEFRAQMGNFIRPSFDPISALGEHAAMCHYSSSKETDIRLMGDTLYLTDTGAGFLEGSTDITRTYALGEPPRHMREHFTLVTMANLRLAEAVFIKGTTGANLDILARQPFWERGLDFKHGTGHGVGYLLSIHEGPASICWLNRPSCMLPLEPGMILTDEPGMYVEDSHGIRLENELLVQEHCKTEFGQFMSFEVLTYIPFDLDAICPDMMSQEDKKRLNAYHKRVYEKTEAYLTDEEKCWLAKYTREI